MRTLLYKEVRETFKLAIAGGLVLSGALGFNWHNYSVQLKNLQLGNVDMRESMQPLLGQEILQFLPMFCAVFGALLGALQGWREHRQGLWEFLVHRPTTPERIFLTKAIGGLSCYAGGVGVPLLFYLGWVVAPGNVPAPFEPGMLLPVAGSFLLGGCCYFAGMLAIIRQARWYASKLVPLAAAFVAFGLSIFMPEFWQAALTILGATCIFAMAAAGSFRTHGAAEGPVGIRRCATAITLAVGWGLVALAAGMVLGDILSRNSARSMSHYLVTRNSEIFKITRSPDKRPQIYTLQGRQAEQAPGKPITYAELQERAAESATSYSGGPGSKWDTPWWFRMRTDYRQHSATSAAVWFFQFSRGRFLAYEMATGKFAGSLGPEGFSSSVEGSGARFLSNIQHDLAADSNTLYHYNLDERSIKPIFRVPDAPILNLTSFHSNKGPRHTVLTTAKNIYILDVRGQLAATAAYDPGLPEYPITRVYAMEPPGRFAVWFEPDRATNRLHNFSLPIHVQWLNGRPLDAPAQLEVLDKGKNGAPDAELRGMALMMPPIVLEPMRWMAANPSFVSWRWPLLICSMGSMLVSFMIGMWWMKRYELTGRTRIAWGIFLILGGLPALLALFSARQWPTRVTCQGCGHLRSADQQKCARCGSGFPPAVRQGTEIFETARN